MIQERDLLDLRDAVAANAVWLTSSDRARGYFERKMPLLEEVVELAIERMRERAAIGGAHA